MLQFINIEIQTFYETIKLVILIICYYAYGMAGIAV